MNITLEHLIPIKNLKELKIYWDEENKEVVFEKDKKFFAIPKREIFPLQRALTRIFQRGFYRRKK